MSSRATVDAEAAEFEANIFRPAVPTVLAPMQRGQITVTLTVICYSVILPTGFGLGG